PHSFGRMRFEGFFASFSPSFDPITHSPFTYTQRCCNLFLWPAFLFQFPGSFSSFFSPIGFLWCSHASYRITLDFLLPMSVIACFIPSAMSKNALSLDFHWYTDLPFLGSGCSFAIGVCSQRQGRRIIGITLASFLLCLSMAICSGWL